MLPLSDSRTSPTIAVTITVAAITTTIIIELGFCNSSW